MSLVSTDLLTSMNPAASSAANGGNLTDNSPSAIQNRFLKLLTVQMKNQDPTNPMDNSQFTSQVAQLSTVSGINQLNATLASLMSDFKSAQSLQSANMIGHSVLAPGNKLTLTSATAANPDGTTTTSQKAVFGVQLPSAVDSLQVLIRDSTGKVVQQLDLGRQDAGPLPVIWDGTNAAGSKSADGGYTFEVAAGLSDGTKIDASALSFGNVSSVSTGADGVKLNVSNIGTIKVSDVVQIL